MLKGVSRGREWAGEKEVWNAFQERCKFVTYVCFLCMDFRRGIPGKGHRYFDILSSTCRAS